MRFSKQSGRNSSQNLVASLLATCLLALTLIAGCGLNRVDSDVDVDLQFLVAPAALSNLEVDVPWGFKLTLLGPKSTPTYIVIYGPSGLTVDNLGRITWTPTLGDLGTASVRIEARDGRQMAKVNFSLRVHQGILMGTAYSPLGHDVGVVTQDALDFLTATTHGRLVGYHTNWRDDGDTNAEIPMLVQSAMAARDQFGIEPTLVLGWADGQGVPDLTSDSQPNNNTWTNAETRQEFLDMLTAVAATYRPKRLAIANEFNIWWATHPSEYADWISLYQDAYDAIKLASSNTKVYLTFQLEFLKGEGQGWAHGVTWPAFDQMVLDGPMDIAAFTSYPYLEYATPAAIPASHYDDISAHWDRGPVAFSEIGWLAAPSFPYPGGQADQVAFLDRFFSLTTNINMKLVQWLFLHDVDGQAMFPPFVGIGLRSNDGTILRPIDQAWQEAVSLREL
ncbi:MAG: Ig domain-containing protein [Planctomycetota bacterium]